MTSTAYPTAPQAGTDRKASALVGLAAAIGSVIVVEIVALIGKAAGAPHVKQLEPGALAFLTIVGVVIGTAAWIAIGRRANGERALRILVPAVLLVSIVPDLGLGANGTAWSAVVTLVIAHASVFAVTIPILLARLHPRSSAVSR